MQTVCCYEIDIPKVEDGLTEPEFLLHIYVNGVLLVDDKIPTDTTTLGVAIAKGAQAVILTGQNDLGNGRQPRWVTHPARIQEDQIDAGDYSRVEHVSESEIDEAELRNGLVTYVVRKQSDVAPETLSFTIEDSPSTSAPQEPAVPEDPPSPEAVDVSTTPEPVAPPPPPPAADGPLV